MLGRTSRTSTRSTTSIRALAIPGLAAARSYAPVARRWKRLAALGAKKSMVLPDPQLSIISSRRSLLASQRSH